MPKRNDNKGFTLIEIMVVIAIFGIITTVIYSLFFSGFRSFDLGIKQAAIQQDIRYLENIMYRQLRNASCVGFGDEGDCENNPKTLTLVSDNDLYYLEHNGDKKSDSIFKEIIVKIKRDNGNFTNVIKFIISIEGQSDFETQIRLNNVRLKNYDSALEGSIQLTEDTFYYKPVVID